MGSKPSFARAVAWTGATVWSLVALVAVGVALLAVPAGAALDVAVQEAVLERAPVALADRADAIARLVDPPAYALWVLLLCGVALLRGRTRAAVAVAVVAVGTGLTTQILKVTLAHPRAADALTGVQVDAASWPSGHTTAAATLALCAVLVAPALLRPVVAVLGGAAAATIAAATVVAGWHLPSDVLGGMLVAATWTAGAAAVLAALPRPSRRTPAPRRATRPVLRTASAPAGRR